jgi:cytochrome P450
MTGDILDIDLVSQSFRRDPFPTLARLREAGPVVRVKLPFLGKTWLATTHEVVNKVLKDETTFVRNASSAGKPALFGRWWMPRTLRILNDTMMGHDDPDHRRLRKLVDEAFNRQSVEGMRPSIAGICDGLLERLPGPGPVDLMERIARPLPLTVICELLGLPEGDRPAFRRWVKRMASAACLWGVLWSLPALFRMMGYFKRHFAQCRRHPRPGLMTALTQAEQDGDQLSENELLAMVFLLLVAGYATTVHLIGGGILALLEAPEQKARLTADWSLVPSAVEELLRFVSPAQISEERYANHDVQFHGQALRRGDIVVASLASANSDPARFDHPERLDITRSPNPHVAFGTGAHFCLGAQLARIEAQVAIEKVFSRFPNLSLAVPGDVLRYTGQINLRALTALPVRLT